MPEREHLLSISISKYHWTSKRFLIKVFFNIKKKIVSKPVDVIMSANRILIDVEGWVMLQFASGSTLWSHLNAESITHEFLFVISSTVVQSRLTLTVCCSREKNRGRRGCLLPERWHLSKDLSAVRNKATDLFRVRHSWQRERKCKGPKMEKDLPKGRQSK